MIMMSMRTDGDTERFENAIKKLSDRICALREQLDLAKKQLSASDMVKGEIDRMKEALSRLDVTFSEYDDVTVRRLVECIRVMRGKRIVIILKGGLKIEEAIE